MSDSKHWTKREMRLMNGYTDLMGAVVRQWIEDGCHDNDKDSVNIWAELLRSHSNVNRDNVYKCSLNHQLFNHALKEEGVF